MQRRALRIIATLAALLGVTGAAVSASGELPRGEAKRLIGNGDVAALLTPHERAQLRALMARSDGSDDVEHFLALKASIEITINPEARVSVRRTLVEMPGFACGAPNPLLIRIVNQAHVTSSLSARPVDGSESPTVQVAPIRPRLTGEPTEYRVLWLSLMHSGTTDITLSFDAGPGTGDLGNRAVLSMLVQCHVAYE